MRLLCLSPVRVALACLPLLAVGCGDDGGGDTDANLPANDAAPTPDAPGADAPLPLYQGLGQSCTGMGQGDCPGGFECLNLNGATGTWCSQPCVDPNDQVCVTGYTGPGVPSCLLSVDRDNDGTADFNTCLVLCQDGPAAGDGCAGCDGTCPGNMICDQEIMDTNGEVVALSCR